MKLFPVQTDRLRGYWLYLLIRPSPIPVKILELFYLGTEWVTTGSKQNLPSEKLITHD